MPGNINFLIVAQTKSHSQVQNRKYPQFQTIDRTDYKRLPSLGN